MGFIESKLYIHPQTSSCLIPVTLRLWTVTIKFHEREWFQDLSGYVGPLVQSAKFSASSGALL